MFLPTHIVIHIRLFGLHAEILSMTKKTLSRHIRQLSLDNNIQLEYQKKLSVTQAVAELRLRYPCTSRDQLPWPPNDSYYLKFIIIGPIKNISGYYGALHEIGHHMTWPSFPIPPAFNEDSPPSLAVPTSRLEAERLATEWALANAKVEPDKDALKLLLLGLDSYIGMAEIKDEAKEHPIYNLAQRLRMRIHNDRE